MRFPRSTIICYRSGILSSDDLTDIEKEDIRRYNTKEKWYVRRAWLESARRRAAIKGAPIRYLTLTCTRVYDIELLRRNGLIRKTTRYDSDRLAFCEQNSLRYSLIWKLLPGASDCSYTFERLVGVGDPSMPPRLSTIFPRDVINMDLTGTPFSLESSLLLENLDMIPKLFLIQNNSPFTLWLTLRIDESNENPAKKRKANMLLDENLKDQDFKTAFLGRFGQTGNLPYEDFVMTIVPKLVIRSGSKNLDVRCPKRFVYVGEGNVSKMASFIFECDQIDKLANEQTLKKKRLVEFVSMGQENVNAILDGDNKIREECRRMKLEYEEVSL